MKQKLILEVMYKASYCLPCYYMDEAVREILPAYADNVEYRRVDILTPAGKKRFIELSVSLFGEEGVFRHSRIAPIPSLFIDGELCFDAIPPRHELEEAVSEFINGTCAAWSFEGVGSRRFSWTWRRTVTTLILEIMHEGDHWIPCVYMARLVETVAPEFAGILTWTSVMTKTREGALRYMALVRSLGRRIPVPSIVVNGELVFDTIPGEQELRSYLEGRCGRT